VTPTEVGQNWRRSHARVDLYAPKAKFAGRCAGRTEPDLMVNVRQRPPISEHVHAGCYSVSHSLRTGPAARRHAGSPVARIVVTKSRNGPVRSSSPIRTARSLVWMM
jgi:hypothetical protein